MTPKQKAAMQQLAAALGVSERKPIPKDMAGRVLGEVFDSMAGGATLRDDNGKRTLQVQHGSASVADALAGIGKSTPPKGSEVEKLASYLAGTDVAAPSAVDEHTATMQAAIERIEAALNKVTERVFADTTDEETEQ